jgi:hypothetical protein
MVRFVAQMAELADALHSGCSDLMVVQVRLLFRAQLPHAKPPHF